MEITIKSFFLYFFFFWHFNVTEENIKKVGGKLRFIIVTFCAWNWQL